MTATALLKSKPKPTDADIDAAMSGQPLPLRHLRTDPRRDQAGGGREGSHRMNAPLDMIPPAPRASVTDGEFVIANVSRRRFLQQTSALGGLVLAVGFPASPCGADDPPKYGADGMPHGWVDNPLVFIAIGEDGIVSIVCHRSEMGQGVRTGMPMIVADELEADWKRVRVVQAPGDEERYGNQDTDGSRSTRHFFMPMRRCGAAARQMLETAAATEWKVPVGEVEARNHEVVHKGSGKRWAMAPSRRRRPNCRVPPMDEVAPEESVAVPLHRNRQAQARRRRGHRHRQGAVRHRHVDCTACCSPSSRVRRCYGGKVKTFDAADALKVPGVVNVVAIDATPGAAAVQPVRRRRRDREKHVGGDAGAQGAEDHVGRRPQRQLRFGGLSQDARSVGGQARQGRAQ